MTKVVRGRILGRTGFVFAELEFDADIMSISPINQEADAPLVLPGFIDTHVHGGGGADTMDGAAGVRKLARFHLEHGTTTLYPTTITNPWSKIIAALRGVKEVISEPSSDLPDMPGVHLEGPFINPKRLGAQPPNAVLPTPKLIEEVLELQVIKLITLAPEIEGALSAVETLVKA
ncbi:MAG: amidohydrolase family protein, partial [Trueperaceae bacterium]|nr:amidohydrolase family protein [Trueperaceae bacterium]